jgi:hypothetical protein
MALRETIHPQWMTRSLGMGNPAWFDLMWTHHRHFPERQRRLFACACCRRAWSLLTARGSRRAVETAERYVEAAATPAELALAYRAARRVSRKLREPLAATGPGWIATGLEGAVYNAACAADEVARPALHEGGYRVTYTIWHALLEVEAITVCPDWSSETYRAICRGEGEFADALEAELADMYRDVLGRLTEHSRFPTGPDPAWLRWHGGLVAHMAQTIYDERRFDELPVVADALEEAGCRDGALLGHCRSGGPHVRGCWALELLTGWW